jgi:hypothetical protein
MGWGIKIEPQGNRVSTVEGIGLIGLVKLEESFCETPNTLERAEWNTSEVEEGVWLFKCWLVERVHHS